jgi:BirA family biotin operon repressor/biotin-[acetyl-CoA-carboxylase] ligase
MNLDAKVLQAFIRAEGQFVSGTEIGESIGLSRVSVHNHLETLRKSGFVFAAIRNKGYRLEKEPHAFHPTLFEALLHEAPCPFFDSYLTLNEVDSTNDVAELELSKGREAPFFVLADTQTSGRGRRGRIWHSPDKANLYLSVALRPSLPPSRLQTITLWLGMRICMLLRDTYALPVLIKWPNDLILHGKKIAGMLTEARVDAEQTRDLVFGVGLNVNSTEDDFPGELASIASSLALNTGKSINLSRLSIKIIHQLAAAIQEYLDDQYVDELTNLWPEFDYLRGQTVQAGEFEGRVLGINKTGSLRLERPDGSTVLLHSGEVTIGSGQK